MKSDSLIIRCDLTGMVTDVLHEAGRLAGRAQPNRALTSVVRRDSFNKVLDFIATVRSDGSAFDYEVNIGDQDDIILYRISGATEADTMTVALIPADNHSNMLIDELSRINSEQATILRQLFQDRSSNKGTDHPLNSLTQINNELISAQRELAKANAQLKIANGIAEKATRALYEREHFIRTVTNNVPALIGYWDTDLRCRFANKSYLEWFGKTQEQMAGISIYNFMSKELFSASEPNIRKVLRGEPQSFERMLTKPDGVIINVMAQYIPDFDDKGTTKGFFVLVTDITFVKRAELNLKAANEDLTVARDMAEAANHAKSTFLAMMSHELRTPLNSILGFAELIRDQSFGAIGVSEYTEYAGYIHTSGQHLLNLLNDILDLSKIEAGKMSITPTPIPVEALISDCIRVFRQRADKQGLKLTSEIEDIGVHVMADERAIRQVLFNLLSNAIKFTETGGVHVHMNVNDRSSDMISIIIEVSDTGIGIAPEQLPLLFTPFTQLGRVNTRRFGGTGLGLVITQRFIEMMNGKISVKSKLGEGTHFTLCLPLKLSSAKTSQQTAIPIKSVSASRPLHILIAEDNHINQMLVLSMLRKGGYTFEVVNNGRAAVDAVASGPFDLVLMDHAYRVDAYTYQM